jgi:transcriptional regulator with XRE-family HTH domain
VSELSDYLSERARVDGLGVRAFARRCGISPTTAHRLLNGLAIPDEETLEKVAAGLPAPLNKLIELAGVERPEPFILPSYADQLGKRELWLVRALIRQLLISSGKTPTSADEAVPQDDDDNVTQLRPGTAGRDRARVLRAAHKRPPDTDSDSG